MKIQLITPEEHSRLLEIYESNPTLTLQNKGYEYIGKNKLSDDDNAKIKEIEIILKKAIVGFSSFTNFRLSRSGEIQIRLQYDYGAEDNGPMPHHFTGVGYLLVDELLNGFNEK